MLILLDQNAPKGLRSFLPTHRVRTAREMGSSSLANGALLAAAEAAGFDALITADRNLSFQQNLTGRRLAIVVLSSNSWPLIRTRLGTVAAALTDLRPGDVRHVELGPARMTRG